MVQVLELLMAGPEVKSLLNSEHFSVYGTPLRDWASHSSLERVDGIDDDPPPSSGSNGFGAVPAQGKKQAKGNYRDLLLANQARRPNSESKTRHRRTNLSA